MKHRALALVLMASPAFAVPLSSRVLMVYNSASPESVAIAKYYQAQRGLGPKQMCGIKFHTPPKMVFSPPSGASQVTWILDGQMDFLSIRGAIRGCLVKAGKESVLYVVMSADTPLELSLDAVYRQIPKPKASICQEDMPGAACLYHSLDQYIADIWNQADAAERAFLGVDNPYFAAPSGGNYKPFETLAAYRDKAGAKLIYSVWRLGPRERDARGQIDRAIATEKKGLTGRVCLDSSGAVDAQSKMPPGQEAQCPNAYCLTNWQAYRANRLASAAGLIVEHDATDDTFGTGKAKSCPEAAFYGGAYNPGAYNKGFEWAPGAVGWDMNSYRHWADGAISAGITATVFAAREPFQPLLPVLDGALRDLLHGATIGDALLRNTRWLKWNIVYVGDPLYTPFVGGRGPFAEGRR